MKYKPIILAGLLGASLGILAGPSLDDLVSRFQAKETPRVVIVSQDS
jgi:hypothetical protein